MRRLVLAAFAAGYLTGWPAAGFADQFVVGQVIQQTRPVDVAAVQHLPAVDETVSFLTGRGEETAAYKGALLWSVLQQEGAIVGGGPRSRVAQEIVVTGRDGYAVVLAMGEIDPEFEGKQILLAYEANGQPIALRLVVPGDRYGGRAVKDVVKVEVR